MSGRCVSWFALRRHDARGEHVSLAAHREQDAWLLRVVLEFLAQAGDMHVDRARPRALRVDPPDTAQQFFAADGAVGIVRRGSAGVPLLSRIIRPDRPPQSATRGETGRPPFPSPEIARTPDPAAGPGIAAAPPGCARPVLDAERLDHVIIRAQVQSFDTVGFVAACSKDKSHGKSGAHRGLLQDGKSVTAGKKQVEQDQIAIDGHGQVIRRSFALSASNT